MLTIEEGGLPGSGKTTLANGLEARLRAIRLSPDDWMKPLSTDLWDEASRGKIEALRWKFAQDLLAPDLTEIIEWARSERDTLRTEARALGAAVELPYLSVPGCSFRQDSTPRDGESAHFTRSAVVMVRDIRGTDHWGDGTLRRAFSVGGSIEMRSEPLRGR